MAKKAESYTLRQGHQTTFRRTIVPAAARKDPKRAEAESYQLVLEPGQHYEFSDEELAGLEKEITSGLLVPSDIDEHGRQRAVRPARAVKPGEEPEDETQERKPKGQSRGSRKPKGPEVGAKSEESSPAGEGDA